MKKRIALLIAVVICMSSKAAEYYWVGGTGNWSDFSHHWATASGGSTFYTQLPGQNDNIYFNGSSFTASFQTVTVDGNYSCKTMDWTNALGSSYLINSGRIINIYGSLKLIPSALVVNYYDYSEGFVFKSTTTGNTVTMAGNSASVLTFDGAGGAWTLLDNVSSSKYTSSVNLITGTLNAGGRTIASDMLNSTGTNTRTLNAVGTVFNLGKAGGGNAVSGWNVTTSLVYNADATTMINISNVGYNNLFTGGDKTYATVNFNGATGSINNANTFTTLTFTGTKTITLQSLKIQTVTTMSITGSNCGSRNQIQSDVDGTIATIAKSSGIVTVDYAYLKDLSTSGGAVFNATNSNILSNVTGWNVTNAGPQSFYWKGGSGDWANTSHWSYTSGGITAGCLPSPIDNVFFDGNSFTATGQTMTISTKVYMNSMDWSAVTNNPTFTPYDELNIAGSLKLSANILSVYNYATVNFVGTAAGNTITLGGKSLYSMVFKGTGSWTSSDDVSFGINSVINLNSGTWDASNRTITIGTFNSANNNSKTLNITNAQLNLSYWNLSGTGFSLIHGNSGTINVSNQAFYGLGLSYNKVILSGSPTYFTGSNTFNDLEIAPGKLLYIENGSTQTINHSFIGSGTAGNLTSINSMNSNTPVVNFNIGANVCLDYTALTALKINPSVCYKAYAGVNSVNGGNNTNWIFGTCGSVPQYTGLPTSALTSTSSSCVQGSWKDFYNGSSSSQLICSIKDNGNNLGLTNVNVYTDAAVSFCNGTPYMQRHYVIKPQNQPGSAVQVRLYFTQAEFDAFNAASTTVNTMSDMGITKYQGPTEDGTYNPADATSLSFIPSSAIIYGTAYGVNYAEFTVTGFSEFWFSPAPFVLPLTLLSFEANKQNEQHWLNWQTSNEINVKEFIIERSSDGIIFNAIGNLLAANTAGVHTYSYKDVSPLKGKNFYRLKMIDLDGKFSYSPIKLLQIDKALSIHIETNPSFNKYFNISWTGAQLTDYILINAEGKIIMQNKITGTKLKINVPAAGIYFIRLMDVNAVAQTVKLISY